MHISDHKRCFSLKAEDFSLISPNTLTCPIFRSERDAELTKKLYRAAPVLIRDATDDTPECNPWGIQFQAMFHMSNNSGLFRSHSDFQNLGAIRDGIAWQHDEDRYIPLYEAKMVHHYDHRWATYEPDGQTSRDCTLAEKQDADYHNLPRYWVNEWEVTLRTTRAPDDLVKAYKTSDAAKLRMILQCWAAGYALCQGDVAAAEKLLSIEPHIDKSILDLFADDRKIAEAYAVQLEQDYPLTEEEYGRLAPILLELENTPEFSLEQHVRSLLETRRPKYLLGWRDICRSTDERTVIAGIVPLAAVGNNLPLAFVDFRLSGSQVTAFLANLSSLVFDFVARHKVGGTHLNFFIIKQLPILPPNQYTQADLDFIVPRVLELTYTSHVLKPFAEDLGYHGQPFCFDPERRLQLRCELDAYYAKLYGLTRDELRYILDPADVMGEDYPSETFRVLKNRELSEFGEYRTQRLVLAAWDQQMNPTQ